MKEKTAIKGLLKKSIELQKKAIEIMEDS